MVKDKQNWLMSARSEQRVLVINALVLRCFDNWAYPAH